MSLLNLTGDRGSDRSNLKGFLYIKDGNSNDPPLHHTPCIVPLRRNLAKDSIGNKAWSLLFLQKHRYRIPETYVVPGAAYQAYLKDPEPLMGQLRSEAVRLPDHVYIVRSSTSLEDSEHYSHAGQFKSLPGREGSESLVLAIEELWASAQPPVKSSYTGDLAGNRRDMHYGVILQRMIPAVLSGVSFSKNPVNDQNEIVVEAVEGPGEELMQRGTTPMRWRIARKEIREGDADHQWFRIIGEVAAATARLKKLYGKHIDLEWVFDGHLVYFVQMRGITGKERINIYSNKMAQEMLPGQIKPLVWSVNIPLVNGAWINLLSRITGPLHVRPEDLAKSFYFRTYFNVKTLGELFGEFGVPVESLEETMLSESSARHSFRPGIRTLRHTFRIIRFLGTILRFESFYLREYRELSSRYRELAGELSGEPDPGAFKDRFRRLFEEGRRLAHLNIVTPLLMRIYNRRLSGKMKRIGTDFDRLDFSIDFPEAEDLSPLPAMSRIKRAYDSLPPEVRGECLTFEAVSRLEGAEQLRSEVAEFISRFGHLSESGNDFSYPKWSEDPEFVFRMILNHTESQRKQKTIPFSEIRYSRLRHPRLRASYLKAGRFRVYREQISSLYIFGYGLFRTLFLQLADYWVREGILGNREDIFYLTSQEVDRLLTDGPAEFAISPELLIRERRAEMEASKDLILPPVIYGESAPILERKDLRNFRGTGTSSGKYTGKCRIVRETADFDKVKDGDVVIIPFSDVSWTPVLCRAGAIVAESGGMLSHCSIIAREMGIPSMVSVDNACALPDNVTVTVDGSNGILTLHDHE